MSLDTSIHSELLFEKPPREMPFKPQDEDKEKLLQHYRNRLSMFEKEEQEWLERYESIMSSNTEYHDKTAVVQAKYDQIHSLQKRLSELQGALFTERQQTIKLAGDNAKIQIVNQDNRRKIAELLALTAPKDSGLTYYQDKRPNKTTKGKGKAVYCNICANCKVFEGHEHHHDKLGRVTDTPSNILKTVYMPNEKMNTLALEFEALSKQCDHERAMYESELQALQDDQRVRDREIELRLKSDQEKIDELSVILRKSKEAHTNIMKEYLKARHSSQQNSLHIQQTIQKLRQDNQEMITNLRSTNISTKEQLRDLIKREETKTNDFSSRYRRQTMNNEEALVIIREEYSKLQQEYSDKIEELEQKITRLTEQYRILEKQRYDQEDLYKERVQGLRDTIKAVEIEKENNEMNRKTEHGQPKQRKIRYRSPYNS